MAVSIKDVAKRTGVSTTTVSRALSEGGEGQIAAITRNKIQTVARELGYLPNSAARALVKRCTNAIGVVLVPDTDSRRLSNLQSSLLNGVLEAVGLRAMDTLVFTGRAWYEAAKGNGISPFNDGRCDGLILFHQPPQTPFIGALLDAKVPFVLVNDQRDDLRLSWVDIDNLESAKEMTRYLLGLGHRHIALFTQTREFSHVSPRIDGYREAFAERGADFDSRFLFEDILPWLPETIVGAVDALLAFPEEERPTAIFCTSDGIAFSVMTVLYQRGMRIPEDISVVGFDDDDGAVQQHPPLTTIKQPCDAIGLQAVDLLLQQVKDISCRGQKVMLPAEIILRGSAAAIS